MSCASYMDPRLAAVYDPLNPAGTDDAFYLDLAGPAPKTVLDVGCGTGRLACSLAAIGHTVTGADPAPAMLNVARNRPDGGKVTWVAANAVGLDLKTRFDLITMTGHAFQVLLEDGEVRGALANLRRHLAPGGSLAFETRNPEVREWEEWRPELTREEVQVPGVGPVVVHYDIDSVEGEFVTFETHFRFGPDDVVVAPSTLRFMPRDDLARFLAEAGFGDLTWYGDWNRSPLRPDSPEIIVIAH